MNELLSKVSNGTGSLAQSRADRAVHSLRDAEGSGNGKIRKAAEDFESILVGQWLEQAERSFATVPGTDPDQEKDSAHDQFLSIACQELARGLSHKGGFGIAEMIQQRLEKAAASDAKASTDK